ncbi:MAG: hypothetical protein E6J34_06415 [Chloroflexi bacterium]|nr:MAG: hypothetical protein E6J34_06415 [Chloroflexota bacterium]
MREKRTQLESNAASSQESVQQQVGLAPQTHRLNFRDPNQREAHRQKFMTWLPKVLHDAPGMQWDRLASRVMGYLIRTVADNPDAIAITLALGCAIDAVKNKSLLTYCQHLTGLLARLRSDYGMNDLKQLSTRQIWDRFVEGRTLSRHEVNLLIVYEALAAVHMRRYLEGLSQRQLVCWQPYVLPLLPTGFIEKQAQRKTVETASKERRKAQSDVILPLFPLLVEIAQLRKQAAERLVKEFQKHRDRAIAGEIPLPYHFQYADRLFSVTQDASSVASVKLLEREVIHSLTLWNRTSWVGSHPKQYSRDICREAEQQLGAYAPSHTLYFLQYQGNPENLLWCGDVIAKRGFGRETDGTERGSKRKDFDVSRPGILTPPRSDSQWLKHASRVELSAIIFEPESLYRAALFATALATLALTNGSRLNELLQVSADRFETLVIDELKDQQPTGRKIGILVQHLLPKGSRQESERQFFLIGEVAGRLLTEIGQLLETTHDGMIPVVHPHDNSKEEDLYPEPYLFQWNASADGRLGLLTNGDVGYLLRFLFHGLTLTTRSGTPIRVVTHLLRHVLATHIRTVKNVPAEAVAYLLHHRVMLEGSSRALSVSEATAYYSRMPLERLLALLFEAQSQLASSHMSSYLQVPPPRTLEQMDAALRQIFEQWGLIGPTVFGYCGAGVCVRPDNRALCLGCPHLVPHSGVSSKTKTNHC